jgi:hypothetical protein
MHVDVCHNLQLLHALRLLHMAGNSSSLWGAGTLATICNTLNQSTIDNFGTSCGSDAADVQSTGQFVCSGQCAASVSAILSVRQSCFVPRPRYRGPRNMRRMWACCVQLIQGDSSRCTIAWYQTGQSVCLQQCNGTVAAQLMNPHEHRADADGCQLHYEPPPKQRQRCTAGHVSTCTLLSLNFQEGCRWPVA